MMNCRNVLAKLWGETSGALISAELILVATILVIGLLAGLVTVRDQVVQELGDVAAAISSLNQSYSFSGATGHHSSTAGSTFEDLHDDCDGVFGNDQANVEPACIDVNVAVTGEG